MRVSDPLSGLSFVPPVAGSWSGHFTSLSFSFLFYKRDKIIILYLVHRVVVRIEWVNLHER